jgi:peptide deformylase
MTMPTERQQPDLCTKPSLMVDIPRRPLRLRLYPDAILREVASPVSRFDRRVTDLAAEMVELMLRHEGIGLAAPQVGVLQRLFVADVGNGPVCVVNPQLQLTADEGDEMTEGCLSLPNTRVAIDRSQKIEVRGYEPTGKPLCMTAEGLLARVIQHEVDHLNGVLICDYALPGCDNQGAAHKGFLYE